MKLDKSSNLTIVFNLYYFDCRNGLINGQSQLLKRDDFLVPFHKKQQTHNDRNITFLYSDHVI